MATRPPDHPALAEPSISQPGAISAQVPTRFPFRRDVSPDQHDTDASREKTAEEKRDDFLSLARERWQTIDAAESTLRKKMRDDLSFFASDQWPGKIAQQRNADGRPCLTINRQPGFVRQITNEMRDARPGIEVTPVDNGADPDLAEALQGLIQHIEANSDADVAYARATESQVRIGRGYFRIVPEYASDTGFEQELCIKSIRNQATVYFDHASRELDGSDARYAFIVEDIPLSEYDERFGADSRAGLDDFARLGEKKPTWMPEGAIRIAEYYCLVPKTRTIYELQDGFTLDDDRLADLTRMIAAQQAVDPQFQAPDLTPIRQRVVHGRQLTWALINAVEILDGNEDKTGGRELPGKWIPIIPTYGEEIDVDGEVDYRGIIRDSIDAQRMSNYWKSAMTETVALAPRTPFVAAAGQIEGFEKDWQEANVRNFSVLQYKPQELAGHLVGPPQRQTSEPPIQAMAMLSMQAENDLRSTAGFSYDVGSQEHRPEQSGKAILARQKQGEIGNSHFQAHLNLSLRHAGRILLDLIPRYYDSPRVKRILGRDGQYRQVVLHAGNSPEAQRVAAQQGIAEARIYDLSIGRYDVRINAGVSYASQRQQDQELLVNALQTNPNLMPLIGDLFFLTLDSPIARRISQRLEKALPPGLQDKPDGEAPLPAEVMQQMQQMQQMVEALTQQLNAKTDELEDNAAELASKERIAQIEAETKMTIEQAKIAAEVQLETLKQEGQKALTSIQAESQHALANQKLAADTARTDRQLASAEAQTEAKLGAEQAIAMLQARMQEIEQMVGLDMARLQANNATHIAELKSQPPPSPTSAPSSA